MKMECRKINCFKLILLLLLILCTATMFLYAGNIAQLEIETGNLEPVVFRQSLENSTEEKNVLSEKVYEKRNKNLNYMCNFFKNKTMTETMYTEEDKDALFSHILVDEKHKLLYCYVPKVACTNWKRIFMLLTGQTNTTDVLAIPASAAHEKSIFTKLSKYSTTDINILLKTYTKFLFVRHPFERLLSAFRNKLEQHYLSSKYFQSRFGRFIIKHYRVNASNESLLKGDDVKFSEFVAYLIDQKNKFNEHWKPIYDLCHPCLVNYDIIGKYETLYEDSDFVLQKAGIENVVFPRAPKPSSTSFYLKSYFSALSKETIEQLYKIYFLDFKLFDYGTIDSLYNGIA